MLRTFQFQLYCLWCDSSVFISFTTAACLHQMDHFALKGSSASILIEILEDYSLLCGIFSPSSGKTIMSFIESLICWVSGTLSRQSLSYERLFVLLLFNNKEPRLEQSQFILSRSSNNCRQRRKERNTDPSHGNHCSIFFVVVVVQVLMMKV